MGQTVTLSLKVNRLLAIDEVSLQDSVGVDATDESSVAVFAENKADSPQPWLSMTGVLLEFSESSSSSLDFSGSLETCTFPSIDI